MKSYKFYFSKPEQHNFHEHARINYALLQVMALEKKETKSIFYSVSAVLKLFSVNNKT